jgi:Tol biopolymer transport system component
MEPELVWYDRDGRARGTLGTPADYADVRLSPDQTRALVSIPRAESGARDLWIFDISRNIRTPLTLNASLRNGAIWLPDGRHVVFAEERRNGQVALVQKAADGSGVEKILLEDEFDKEVASASPDGKFIVYNVRRGASRPTPWVLPLTGSRMPRSFPQARAFFPQVSPDGRWVAYISADSGRNDIYVASFPGPGPAVRVSPSGGIDPVWRGDGRELVYRSQGQMISARLATHAGTIGVEHIAPLFALTKVGPRMAHDMSRDGQRILAVSERAEVASAPITLVVDWHGLLRGDVK